MRHRLRDVAVLGTVIILGALAGGLGSFLQASTVLWVPVGLIVALALSLAAATLAGLAVRNRFGAAVALVAWLAAVLSLAGQRPEGDVVLTGRWQTYAWLYGGTLLLALTVVPDYRRLATADPAFRRG